MRVFSNPVGPGTLWFDNLATADGTPVAYDPQARAFLPMPPFCANRDVIDCNWIAPEQGAFCRACAMTALAPDPSIPNAIPNWAQTEAAKRWVLDNLGRWHWFRPEDPGARPVFHMLAEGPTPVPMGHAQGVVTISVAEADPVLSTTRRQALQEPYRTMIGHLRHEISHMLWWRLSLREDFLDAFRVTFGDERADYPAALQRHYNDGPPTDWKQRFLSIITDPNLTFIFITLGMYGLIYELANPGALVPGTVGVISIVLAMLAMNIMPINYGGLALLIWAKIPERKTGATMYSCRIPRACRTLATRSGRAWARIFSSPGWM